MKKYINILLIMFVMFFFSCAHNVDQSEYPNYTPPSVKYKPRLLYPVSAQENEYTGNTKVMIMISKEGTADKVELTRSSGFNVLDNAALIFCRNMLFNPAIRNGKPVNSKMEWEIKFNFYEQPWDVNKYVQEVQNMYREYSYSSNYIRNILLHKILTDHNEFIHNMKDGLNFNFYIEKVISSDLAAKWKKDWNAWPLSFLLYQDFIERFPDYDSLKNVKKQLSSALKIDIQYIKNMPVNSSKTREEKDYILYRINQFIKNNYPDMMPDSAELNAKNIRKLPS